MTMGIIAHGVFWAVLFVGWSELGTTRAVVFLALWVLGYIGSNWFLSSGLVFGSYVAILDIVMVLMAFKGDALRL